MSRIDLCHPVAPAARQVVICLPAEPDLLALSIVLDLFAAANRLSGREIFAVDAKAMTEAATRIRDLPEALVLVADGNVDAGIATTLAAHPGAVGGWGAGVALLAASGRTDGFLFSPGRIQVSELVLDLIEAAAGRGLRIAVMDHCQIRSASCEMEALHSSDDPRIAAAELWITRNIARRFTAKEMARALGLSTRQVERLFRRHLGRSPSAHLDLRRLSHARRMLNETFQSEAEIARATGYDNLAAFRRKFRRRYGINPSEAS